jgi:hypothetical protein
VAINPDLTKLRKEIDRLLAEKRPDRYTVSDTTVEAEEVADEEVDEGSETEWLDEIADEVAHMVPEAELRKLYARKIVGQQEGKATSRANRLLRKIHRTGQLVLGWWGVADDPVAVVTRVDEPGQRTRRKDERVALRAMTPRDFRDFATEERRRAAEDFTARNDTCTGAELVATWMTQGGFTHFQQWAEHELPIPDDVDGDLP